MLAIRESKQNYESHLKRLTTIIREDRSVSSLSVRKPITLPKKASSVELKLRIQTLPLIPDSQKQLLKESLASSKLPSKLAQNVLENYLLSRRIITIKPSISREKLIRDFAKHRNYKQLREKHSISSNQLSSQRIAKFREFEANTAKKSIPQGHGKYIFSLTITKYRPILRRELRENNLFSLHLQFKQNTHSFEKIQRIASPQVYQFRFKQKHMGFPAIINAYIEEFNGMNSCMLGMFQIDLADVFKQVNNATRPFLIQKSQIQGLKTVQRGQMIGTVTLHYAITHD